MAQSIRESCAKSLLRQHFDLAEPCVCVSKNSPLSTLPQHETWLAPPARLVVKPDVLLKRRGKSGMVLLDVDWPTAFDFLQEKLGQDVVVEGLTGELSHFIVEPFFPHKQEHEFYVAIRTLREADEILFSSRGGINVGDVESHAQRIRVPVAADGSIPEISEVSLGQLLTQIKEANIKGALQVFIRRLYVAFCQAHFAFLEINPLIFDEIAGKIRVLDCAAKLDHTAEGLCEHLWGTPDFPNPFGRRTTEAEQYIRDLDSKTGSSLKLTVLNPHGRIWTLIAGGGASVVFADTICDLGQAGELANYGEYSGAPSEATTYEYARTVLNLATADGTYHKEGKILLIAGGIANFTSVADTFKGIIRALKEYQVRLHEFRVRIYVRRGGPSYQDGLRLMRDVGQQLQLPIKVYGPETYITAIIPLALQEDAMYRGDTEDEDVSGDAGRLPGAAGDRSFTPHSSAMMKSPSEAFRMQQQRITTPKVELAGVGAVADSERSLKRNILMSQQEDQPKDEVLEDDALSEDDGRASLQSWCEMKMEQVEADPNFQSFSLKSRTTKPRSSVSSTPSASPVAGPSAVPSGPWLAAASADAAGGATPEHQRRLVADFKPLFSIHTRCIVWGLQTIAVQEMLDFDHVCGRKTPSVAALVYEFSVSHLRPFYFGTEEIFIPVCQTLKEAVSQFPEVDTLINFASMRSAADVTKKALLQHPNIRTVAVIAEGVPERRARELIQICKLRDDRAILGPATVGGIKSGCLRVGNTGGRLENIMNAKLYRPGSVGFVTKSGGMLNEVNNILSIVADGTNEGVAIGGDRFPGTTMLHHLMRYEKDPSIKILVVLGEVGGTVEYEVADALKAGVITKPVVAWCVGTCANLFTTDVSFGHAGSWAGSFSEHAAAKNEALKAAGAHVPKNFMDFGTTIKQVFEDLIAKGTITRLVEPKVPRVPMDYAWAKKLGFVRRPKGFVSTISDDRGEELVYAGWPISKVMESDMGIGGVIALLWFKRPLPNYCYRYLETVLMLTGDHGPAVCGAHNTIVTARAGKDLISSLIAGLCTIGDRFGGACDQAANQFLDAYGSGAAPEEFVQQMKQEGRLIMGIGHKIKSVHNPDMRVVLLKTFCKNHFPKTPLIDFAEAVEKFTTRKKDTLILNVDGLIGVSMCDMLYTCGAFTEAEARDYISCGCINGLFVLGRSVGFIGHYLDQKRLKQGLYRHDADDISYVLPDLNRE